LSESTQSAFRGDLIIAVVVVIAIWTLGLLLNLFEPLHEIIHSYEQWLLDEILLSLLVTSLVAFWFSYRRQKEVINESEKVSKSEAEVLKYHDIVKNMQIGLLVYQLESVDDDSTLRLIDANPMASEFAGVDIEPLIGMTIDEAFPDIRRHGLPHRYAEVARTGEPFFIDEIEYEDEQVKRSTFSVRAFALPDHCVGVLFEYTSERSRIERALRESEEHFRELVENIEEVFWVGAPDWSEVFYVSPNYEILWERSCESLYDNPMQWLMLWLMRIARRSERLFNKGFRRG